MAIIEGRGFRVGLVSSMGIEWGLGTGGMVRIIGGEEKGEDRRGL